MNTKRNMNNTLILKISALACLLSSLVFSYLLFQSSQSKNLALASSYNSDQVIVAVNKERIKKSLKPLLVNSILNKAAENKAKDMVGKSYFSHISPSGKKWSAFIRDVGYNYAEAGENLANGYDTVGEMVAAWMNSPTHRENILNSQVIETGVGVEYGKLPLVCLRSGVCCRCGLRDVERSIVAGLS